MILLNRVLSQVQEIFGDDFNFDDFKNLGDVSGEEEDYPYESYDDVSNRVF